MAGKPGTQTVCGVEIPAEQRTPLVEALLRSDRTTPGNGPKTATANRATRRRNPAAQGIAGSAETPAATQPAQRPQRPALGFRRKEEAEHARRKTARLRQTLQDAGPGHS